MRLRFSLMFGNGAPEEIRTPNPQIRSLKYKHITVLDFRTLSIISY